jgi:hypothetical protein
MRRVKNIAVFSALARVIFAPELKGFGVAIDATITRFFLPEQ